MENPHMARKRNRRGANQPPEASRSGPIIDGVLQPADRPPLTERPIEACDAARIDAALAAVATLPRMERFLFFRELAPTLNPEELATLSSNCAASPEHIAALSPPNFLREQLGEYNKEAVVPVISALRAVQGKGALTRALRASERHKIIADCKAAGMTDDEIFDRLKKVCPELVLKEGLDKTARDAICKGERKPTQGELISRKAVFDHFRRKARQ
jgi:hypothetical protein